MRNPVLVGIACVALTVIAVSPAGAAAGIPRGAARDAPAQITGSPPATPEVLLPELEALAGMSVTAATNDPDNGYTPLPKTSSFGPDGTDGSEEGNTRLTTGVLVSEIVVSAGGARSVATVNAHVCPDERGAVTMHLKMTVGSATADDRVIEARATGTANDNADLTSPTVTVVTGKGADAKLLRRTGLAILHQAEQSWRNGYCVKVDVSDGQSRAVKPKEKVSISATAKPRFGAGAITGRMESKRAAGQKKVEPAKVSSSPAKFTYTAPDKSPEAGSVQLKSVSKRGIGIADLAYTTEGDLKIDAAVGQGHATAVKCSGPAGSWDLAYTVATQGNVAGHIAVTLAKDTLSGTWQAGGFAQAGGQSTTTGSGGTASYRAAPDGKSGTLTLTPGGDVPVTVGTFCQDGVAPGG